ncbi:hypothetical protein BDN72DRAFT_252180 [Pluteus cervinus]|uniref:Uncharacterized protein n=1 Tax=Pluteus cervinus TaxID=181527 RepID=A0ACD3AGU0_9AGAR|nr:hypothetical protein BDN72DRAFT_252180 [Pluteus cervinus]
MGNGNHAQEVDFHKALSVWATTVLKDKPTAGQLQDTCRTVLQPLEETIKAKVLDVSTAVAAKPQAGDWSVNDLLSALNRVSSSQCSHQRDSYADWIKLVNRGLWLVRNLESDIAKVDFRGNTENILLQHDGGNYFQNGEIVDDERSTAIITQTTANALHGSARQERRWFPIAKYLAASRFSDDRARAAHWRKSTALLRCEHQEADFTPEEHDSLTSLDFRFFGSWQLPGRPKALVDDDNYEGWDGEDDASKKLWRKSQKLSPGMKRRPGRGPHDVISTWELEQEELAFKSRPYERAKKYLRDRLGWHVNMTHAYAIILTGRQLQMMYADRQGIIVTTPIHVVREFPSFLALLFVLQRFSLKEWGEHPGISKDVLQVGGIRYRIGSRKFHTPADIVGTQNLIVPLLGPNEKFYTAKFSWQTKATAELEHSWLKKAWDAAPRDRNHLLECIGWREYDPVTTRTIRECFGLDVGEPRRYYVIVLPDVFITKSLRQLNGEHWLRTFWDCFKVYFKLWTLGICHGNVTDTNMVGVPREGNDKEWVGVLINFDHASSPTNLDEQKGSGIFQSQILHGREGGIEGDSRPRSWYDEVESFLWVGVYDTCAYGKLPTSPRPTRKQLEIRDSIVFGWYEMESNARVLFGQKMLWLMEEPWDNHLPVVEHEHNWPWIRKLAQVVASEESKQMEDIDLYNVIIAEVCEPSLRSWKSEFVCYD